MRLASVGFLLMAILLIYSILLFFVVGILGHLQARLLVIISLVTGFLVGRKFVNPFSSGCLAGFQSL